MGIERFFSSIEENKIANMHSEFTTTHKNRIPCTYFFIDFNSIVHVISKKTMQDINYLLFKIIQNKYTDNKKATEILKRYEIDKDITLEKFNKQVTDEFVNNLIIKEVLNAMYKLLEFYIYPSELKYLYIAIDGTPSKSKIIEQKKRRYMGAIHSGIRNNIFNKHENELKKDKDRYTFEKMKINWNKTLITPGTDFFHKMHLALNSFEFQSNIQKICKNIKTYEYSGPYEPGEGEKKIVDKLRSMPQEKSNYVIFSPDSDVTLLGLLLNNKMSSEDPRKVTKLKILRHNQQKDNYDVIDIDKLSNNIYNYVIENMKGKGVPEQDNIIDDIVFTLTLFGNDFLPKMESFNVRYDFNRIIDIYIGVLIAIKNNKFNYLIQFDKKLNKKYLNQEFFIEFIRLLHLDEGGNLQRNYISSHYQNYNKLKKLLGATYANFTTVMNDFLEKIRDFNKQVRHNKTSTEIINKFDKRFLQNLQKLTRLNYQSTKNIDDFVKQYIIYYKNNKKLPKIMITFRRYSKSLDNHFYKNKLENSLNHLGPKIKITSYDEELYKFENMLDEYKHKLNNKSMELGNVYIDSTSYVWKAEKILKGVQKYYKDFFKINDISINNEKMKEVTQHYIDGLIWVFEYYYNNFDINYNRNNALVWQYPYTKAPLMTQIYQLLKENKNNPQYLVQSGNKIKKQIIKGTNHFNSIEQLMYVTPAKGMEWIMPPEYKDFIQKSNYYPDIHKIVQEIWSQPNNDEIDCIGQMFLNKCLIRATKIPPPISDKQFIKQLRNIKLTPTTMEKAGIFYQKPRVKVYNYYSEIPINKIRTKELHRAYGFYKKKYLQSRNCNHKIIYKNMKKLLLAENM